MENENITNPELEDVRKQILETSFKTKILNEYIGQDKVKESMKVYIEAAKKR